MTEKVLRFRWLIIAVMVLAFAPKTVLAQTTVTPEQPLLGDGSEGNPYQIKTKENLYWFAEQVNNRRIYYANAKLMNNIIVNENVLNPDGSLKSTNPEEELIPWTPIDNFTDTFDGQGYTISGLYFNDAEKSKVGLFKSLWSFWSAIKNVGIVDSYFYGKDHVGGVCGENRNSTIEGCYNTGTVNGAYHVGGVCGFNDASIINKCYSTGAVNGYEHVGGICGGIETIGIGEIHPFPSQIENCYNYGSVKGNYYVGGVCGENINVFITNCYYLEGCVTCENTNLIVTEGTEKTAKEFASGEVAWLLNGSTSNGDLTWGQKVTLITDEDESRRQIYPTFGGDRVFSCKNGDYHNHFAYCSECGGEPTQNDEGYYEISNTQELYWFAEHVNSGNTTANAILTADIVIYKNLLDTNGNPTGYVTNNWSPIGKNDEDGYKGIFDGQGHTISGMYFNDINEKKMHIGLFGTLGDNENQSDATIKNVGVTDSYFACNLYSGGICGNVKQGTISNCYNAGTVMSETSGGVCGFLDNGTVENCHNIGRINGKNYAGGICGETEESSSVKNCYYLDGCIGNETNANTEGTEKNAEAFASGEVAWLLNGNKLNYESDEVPTDASTWKWYQKLGSNKHPVLKSTGSNTVYAAKKKCADNNLCGWTNTQTAQLAIEHEYGEEITLSEKADNNTQNLYSYIQTCTTSGCGATKIADKKENVKLIKDLNVAGDNIEITKENTVWKTTEGITLYDDPTNNWYKAPVEFIMNGSVTHNRAITTEWSTLCLPYKITVSNHTDKCKFYELKNVETDKVTLTELTGDIEAGTPVFIRRNSASVTEIAFEESNVKMIQTPTEQDVNGNKLVGAFNTVELTTEDNGDYLFLKNDNMWSVTQANKTMKVKPFRAYIVPATPSSAPQRSIAVDGEATAVSDVLDTLNDANAEYYDMSGHRINSLQKGVNIIRSGNKTRKVIIR